jgi:hypothetical protein
VLALQSAAAAAGAQARTDQLLADSEVAAAEKLLAAAQIEFAAAADDQARLAGAAALIADRAEAGKAAAAAMAGGLAATAPFAAAGGAAGGAPGELLSLASALACCALFGVAYRYVVREDGGNPHLRGGAVAAFGLVRAAGGLDMLQRSAAAAGTSGSSSGGGWEPLLSPAVLGPAALYAGQSMLVFGFAAAAVEFAFRSGLVRRVRGAAFYH